ncbi:MAG: T9SS type A sorting domain-containing protein [Bacteroidetes bacterium]|nr:T9SS type A sorting domain-containing protein [Bacteroidota bacterium]
MNTTVCPTTSTCYLLVVSNIKGCKDSDTVCVNILPPTPATWSQSLPELCSGDASVLLTGGQPSGGYYQGNGVYSGNWFNAGLAGEGIQTLYYYYTDTCGNTNVVSNTISVIDCPCEPTICQGLNDNNLHEWQARPGYSQINVQLSNNLSINGSSDYYILTTDQTGASMLMADTAFQGRWCCGEFCYDYRVFDDGDSTAVLDIYPVFYIMRDTKGFKFTSSIAVNENNGWQHICAPVTNCNPAPISTLGVWEPMPGTAANDWDPVTNHIDSVFFHTEFNYGDEVNAFDNICFNSTPLSVSLINPACTDSIYALVSGCCGPYNYQWSEPSFGNSANIGGAIQYSTYTVTVTNSTGEESSATITLVTSPDCCLDTCDYFEQGPHSWMNSIPGAPVFIQTPGTSGLPSDHFLMIPNSGFSQRYLIADSAFLGKWCCGELCFDFKISNDYGLHFNPGFEISNGVLTFRFISSTNVSQASGWQHICAPISDCGFQSVSNLGSWTPVPPATANDWNTVLNHITSLKFIIPASSSYDGTVFTSFDNVCLNPSVSHVYIEPSICNDSLCIRATGCCNSFSYLWSNGSTTECIGGLIEGNVYTATVTDQNGITYTASLAAPPRLHVECFGGTANSCAGIIPTGQITATTFGGTGMKSIIVRRDGPNGPIVASSSALLNQSYIFNGLTAGHYCIFVEDANGCKDSCCCDLLPFIWLPGKTQIPPLCSNSFDGSIDVGNFTNGNFPYSYNWNNGATTAAISNLGPGFYVVTITDFNGCTIVDSTTLTAPPPITTGVITGSGALCTSTPQVLTYSIAAVPSAISYSWTVPAGATIVSGQGTTSLTISINASALNSGVKGPICVSGYDNCGLGAPSCMNLDFNVTKPVTPPSISGPSKVCPGDLVTYSISAVARASSYNWSLPSGMTITSGGGSNVIIATVLSGYTGGALSVSAVNVCGASPLRTKNLLQNIPSTPGTIIGPLNGVCGATGLMYSVPPVINATSYQWSIANGINPSALNTNSVTFDWNNNDTVCNISVVALNSCGTSGTRSAIIQGKPAKPGPISGNSSVCTNGIYPYSIGTVAGSLNYNWFVPGGTSIISGQFTKTMTLGYGSIPAVSQSISVVAGNNCGTSASRQLNGISINVCPRFGEISFDQIGFTALDVYPNPAHDKLNILFTSEENSQYSLRLIDISGKIVYSETGTGDGTLKHSLWNTEQYASGLYMLQLFTEKSMSRIAVMIE